MPYQKKAKKAKAKGEKIRKVKQSGPAKKTKQALKGSKY